MSLRLLFIVIFTSFSTLIFAQQEDSLQAEQNTNYTDDINPGYVIFNFDTLFIIPGNLGDFTAVDRAELVSERIRKLKNEITIKPDSFVISESDSNVLIYYKNSPLLSITESDARLLKKNQRELAQEYLTSIQASLENRIVNKPPTYWALHILYTLLAIFGLFVIFSLVNRMFRWLYAYVEKYQSKIKRQRKSFWRYLSPKGPDNFFAFILKITKILILATILFFYLPLIFNFLPWTEGLVNQFYIYISDPLKQVFISLWEFITQKLVYIIIIFFVARYILHILKYVSTELANEKLKIKGFHHDWAKPTFNLVKMVIIIFAFVFMFPYLPGSNSKAFQGVSIFLGVLFSLGSTSAIANIVAGIVITYMRPFQIGDRVKIGETIGEIEEKNLLVTRVRTLKNEDVTIPNAKIINTHLLNYSKNASKIGIILHPSVTIGYDVPADTVIDLLLKAAKNTKNLTREYKPFVLQKKLSDFYVEYELNVYTKQPGKMAQFYSDLNKSILDEFNKANVEIVSPHYTSVRSGDASTIPDKK